MVYKKAREDFEAFAAGVRRLKELEKELNSLDTKKFKQEERDIRRKLRSVHLIPQIERDMNELKAKISGVDIKALKAELDFEQSRKLAMLEHKEEELERQLSVARKGMLTENEVGAVDNLPLLKKKVSYLRDLLNKDNRNLKEEIDKVSRRKRLTEKEVREINSIPKLNDKISYLKNLLVKEEGKVHSLSQKFSAFSRKEQNVSDLLGKEQAEISKETAEIAILKHKLSYLKELLENKTQEISKEVKKTEASLDRRGLPDEIKELEEKIYNLREDVYSKLIEETSESKWMIQKEKENTREELRNLAKASVKLMQEEKEEATSQLLEEIKKLKRSIETNNKEIQQRITEIEARRNAEKFAREHQQKIISRSQELGLKPKFLERIEHIDDSDNPVSIKEINILSPFGVQQQKRKKETKQESSFKLTEEIPELPPMPLSEDELTFSLKRGFTPEEIYPAPEIRTERKIEFSDIKREVENKALSLPGIRTNIPVLKERKEEPEEKPLIEIKVRKLRVPNKKFLEEGKYNMFFDNLMSLKELSYYNPEMFEEIKPLKEFQESETEKSLENCEIIAKNLLKIRTKILTGIK